MTAARTSAVGDLLKRFRLAAGLTQEQLADRTGLSVRGLSDLERGLRHRPHKDTLALLANALALGPSERALLENAARGEAVVSGDLNGGELARASHHNLPNQMSSFVGREREIADLVGLVGGERALPRLVTLTGIGGVGKSRLALQVAAKVSARYRDGVWLVELASLADPSLVPQTVAAVLGVRESAERDLSGALVDALRPRHLLLLLDNCEHLIGACAALAALVLAECPRLRILATSREVLGVTGETVWRVPSLTTPDLTTLPEVGDELVKTVARADAVQLFAERARQALPNLQVTPANAATLAQIADQLDGIPLAIELAAARLRTLSIEQLAGRLEQRFQLLTSGDRAALRRHRTLRATVDWSHDLLSTAEQTLFRRLAVFAGGWTLEAVEAVCADGVGASRLPGFPMPDTQVLDLLSALVDKSLVLAEGGPGLARRYHFLETLREYALERLRVSGETDFVQSAHAEYYFALVERLAQEMLENRDILHTVFRPDIDNFRIALGWLAKTSDWERCVRLVSSLSDCLEAGGFVAESNRWMALALQHQNEVAPSRRGYVLAYLLSLAFRQRSHREAMAFLRETIQACRATLDDRELSLVLVYLGVVLRDKGEHAEARSLLEEALQIGRDLADQSRIVDSLFQLGILARQMGDLDRAESLLTACMTFPPQVSSFVILESSALHNLGLVAEDRGDLDRALALYTESTRVLQRSEHLWHLAFNLEAFATVAARKGQAERALVLAGAASAMRERVGMLIPPVLKPRLDSALAQARQDLGAAADGAWARGQAMTAEAAIAYALVDEARRSETWDR